MRTNIVIDDTLITEALDISGYKTKKETVEEALKLSFAAKIEDDDDLNIIDFENLFEEKK